MFVLGLPVRIRRTVLGARRRATACTTRVLTAGFPPVITDDILTSVVVFQLVTRPFRAAHSGTDFIYGVPVHTEFTLITYTLTGPSVVTS